jgi:hypothetical protein
MGKTCKKIKKVIDGRAKTIKDFAKYVSEGEVEVLIKKKSISFYLKDKSNKSPPEFLFGLTGTIKAENLKVVENCTRCNSEARKKELDKVEEMLKANKLVGENLMAEAKKLQEKDKDLAQREKELVRYKRLKEIEEQKVLMEQEKAQIIKDNMKESGLTGQDR